MKRSSNHSYNISSLIRGRIFLTTDPFPQKLSSWQLKRVLWMSNAFWFFGLCVAFFVITLLVNYYHEQQSLKLAEMERNKLLEAQIYRLGQLNSHSSSQALKLARNIQSILDTAKGDRREFLSSILPHALRIQALYRIPASAVIGMAIYESGYGRSTLAQKHNNYFGIKAFRDWSGPKVKMPTVDLGISTRAHFRAYQGLAGSVQGYAEFLYGKSRYKKAFQFHEGEKFVAAVAKAGYCPDRNYSHMVGKIIRRHNLSALDTPPELPSLDMPALANTRLQKILGNNPADSESPPILSTLLRRESSEFFSN